MVSWARSAPWQPPLRRRRRAWPERAPHGARARPRAGWARCSARAPARRPRRVRQGPAPRAAPARRTLRRRGRRAQPRRPLRPRLQARPREGAARAQQTVPPQTSHAMLRPGAARPRQVLARAAPARPQWAELRPGRAALRLPPAPRSSQHACPCIRQQTCRAPSRARPGQAAAGAARSPRSPRAAPPARRLPRGRAGARRTRTRSRCRPARSTAWRPQTGTPAVVSIAGRLRAWLMTQTADAHAHTGGLVTIW